MKLVALCSPLEGEYVAPVLWECKIPLRTVGWQMQDSEIYILFLQLNQQHHQLPFYVAFPEVKLEGEVKLMKIKETLSWKHLHSDAASLWEVMLACCLAHVTSSCAKCFRTVRNFFASSLYLLRCWRYRFSINPALKMESKCFSLMTCCNRSTT